VTSPPYWGLRDYGQTGQLGLEPTPEEYVSHMVEVFREVRRVLAPHGTVYLNIGDSFHEKQLVGVPWKLAFALQADGWYLRSDIIWAKPNPMPESVTDRPTKAHEYVFLLSKQPRYFFDQEAVRESHTSTRWGGPTITQPPTTKYAEATADGFNGAAEALSRPGREWNAYPDGGRNIRSVWEIATQPYPEAHFATFPEELARRCIAAGCPEQVCRVCGGGVEGMVETMPERKSKHVETVGWTSCGCNYEAALDAITEDEAMQALNNYRPGRVLDPFIGSGTVAYVARKLGRHAVGIDLNAEYLALAARRLQQQSLFAVESTEGVC
jgi:DNA modification methylase